MFNTIPEDREYHNITEGEIKLIKNEYYIIKENDKMIIWINDTDLIDVKKIRKYLDNIKFIEVQLDTYIDDSKLSNLSIKSENDKTIPYNMWPFVIYNANNTSILWIKNSNFTESRIILIVKMWELY